MPRILIVDDEERLRVLLRAALLRAGYDVETASGPTGAIEACSHDGCFDLILCDIVLPEMDGHQLTRRIAHLCPGSRVIHMSGFDPGCDQCPYLEKCPLVEKPFTVSRIVTIARDALSRPPVPLK